eukprot:scaffold733_cov267-Pinguiococcus_pyrenoidosus.AAC.45
MIGFWHTSLILPICKSPLCEHQLCRWCGRSVCSILCVEAYLVVLGEEAAVRNDALILEGGVIVVLKERGSRKHVVPAPSHVPGGLHRKLSRRLSRSFEAQRSPT